MKKTIAIIIIAVMMVLNVPYAEAASARHMPTAYVMHTYGGATRTYQEGELTTWEQLTDINCTSVTTLDQDSSGTTLYVADTTVFEDCELNRSTVSCDGQILTITGVNAGVSLTVSAITGTITSGTAVMAGFVLECYDDEAPYSDTVDLAGATTNAIFYRVMKAASGHAVTPTSGVRFVSNVTTTISVVVSSENYSGFYDFGVYFSNNGTPIAGRNCIAASGGTAQRVIGCMAWGPENDNSVIRGFLSSNGSDTVFVDCYAFNIGITQGSYTPAGFLIYTTTTSTPYIYNCIARYCRNGLLLYEQSGTLTASSKNCIFQNNTSNISTNGSPTHTQTTNVTSGVTFEADGYHITNDPQAVDQGTDLSADGVFPFDDDIDGETRGGTWDVGCDEYGLLAAPTGVSATDGTYSDKITVNWNAVDSATGYEVWRNTVDESASATRIEDGYGATSYDDETVTLNVTYYYWVKTESAEGESAFSLSDSGYAAPQPPLLTVGRGFNLRQGGWTLNIRRRE